MNKALKIVVVAGLIVAVAAILLLKQQGKETDAVQSFVNAGRCRHTGGRGPASPGRSGVRHVHSLQDDGARSWKRSRRNTRAG